MDWQVRNKVPMRQIDSLFFSPDNKLKQVLIILNMGLL